MPFTLKAHCKQLAYQDCIKKHQSIVTCTQKNLQRFNRRSGSLYASPCITYENSSVDYNNRTT